MVGPARGITFGLLLAAPLWGVAIIGISNIKFLVFEYNVVAMGIGLLQKIDF